ncbi:MAG: hypothetical protein HY290_28235 [Planctomycetia bacterium]|nr:hypothetical protein [Planctomycetia bacterium]
MNCQTARQTLELVRPHDADAPASDEAERHVHDCLDCQTAVRTQRELDEKIGGIFRDVTVPADLKERLLAGIASAQPAAIDESSGSQVCVVAEDRVPARIVAPVRVSRRLWLNKYVLRISAGVAASLVGGFCLWLAVRPAPPTLTLDEVTTQVLDTAPTAMPRFTSFRRGTELKLPATMDVSPLGGAALQAGDLDAAVYVFKMSNRAGPPIEGRLIVIPAAALIDPPTAVSFLAGPTSYKATYCTTAWTEGKLVYICCTTGGETVLQRLKRLSV